MIGWKQYRLGELLISHQQQAVITPGDDYKQIKLRLNQNGVALRGIKKGRDLGSKQFVAKQSQFIISKIDARNGAMGFVPDNLDGAVVTGDFLLFNLRDEIVDQRFFEYCTRNRLFAEACKQSSEGSTNRVRLKIEKFLNFRLDLPPLATQQRIVARIESTKQRVDQIQALRSEQQREIRNLLFSKYTDLVSNAAWLPMSEVAPIVRRDVEIKENESYSELGIRSFGKGTFHKPAITGVEVGTKTLYKIKSGDLMFSNVFAWEGAIAVAKPEDNDRFGSHRFISCVPQKDMVLAEYLCFHFLTEKGLQDINAASPGGAGRNKTLGLQKLMNIKVPAPDISLQQEFVSLLHKLNNVKAHHIQTDSDLTALIPSLLDKAFKGKL